MAAKQAGKTKATDTTPVDASPVDERKPQVAGEPELSFDERTGVQQPWLKKDGTQDNGAENPKEAEGAKAPQNRKGDKNTADEKPVEEAPKEDADVNARQDDEVAVDNGEATKDK